MQADQQRPYWHIDAKWIFGIIFTIFLATSTFFYSLSVLTSKKVFVPIATYFVATQFSRNGLDDATEIEALKKRFDGQKVIRPIPQVDVVITKEDLATLTPRQIRLKIFERVVEPIYEQKRSQESMSQFGYLAFLNYETNLFFNNIFKTSLVPMFLFGLGLFWFSYKFGKLLSFAVVFIFIGFMPYILLNILKLARDHSNGMGLLTKEVLNLAIPPLAGLYSTIFWTGVVLLVLALILKAVSKHR